MGRIECIGRQCPGICKSSRGSSRFLIPSLEYIKLRNFWYRGGLPLSCRRSLALANRTAIGTGSAGGGVGSSVNRRRILRCNSSSS